MYTIHQPWDPLEVCVVGRSYPPEFYSFIENPRLRALFEKIAIETEEDLQGIVDKLEEFGVKVIRPNVPEVVPQEYIDNKLRIPGPVSMIPRDQMIMLGDKFFLFPIKIVAVKSSGMRLERWSTDGATNYLPENSVVDSIVNEASKFNWWGPIIDEIKKSGNEIVDLSQDPELESIIINGITRIGRDLYFGCGAPGRLDEDATRSLIEKNEHLSKYRCHLVNTGGHIDGMFTPVKPKCIVSVSGMKTYENTFPGWEVAWIRNSKKTAEFKKLKFKNQGKWWIPGHENDDELIDLVETWLADWVGFWEESVFSVNILAIDKKNVIVSSYNEEAFNAFKRWGITPHICPLRHSSFWDGGVHCMTLDLSRKGSVVNDYFPDRSKK